MSQQSCGFCWLPASARISQYLSRLILDPLVQRMVAPRVTTTLTPPGIGHDRDLATPANTYNSGTNTFGMRLSTSLFYLAAGVSAYLLGR